MLVQNPAKSQNNILHHDFFKRFYELNILNGNGFNSDESVVVVIVVVFYNYGEK